MAGCTTPPQDPSSNSPTGSPPNILFAFADDWGAHASIYDSSPIETPNFDRVARQGVLFQRAFASSPSCTPSRGALLSGRHVWRLGAGANLFGRFPSSIPVYTRLLENRRDYFVGFTRKGWAPGAYRKAGWEKNPAGQRFSNFQRFLDRHPDDQPFCFWFGSKDPHRSYSDQLRKQLDITPEDVSVPPTLPDRPPVRKDIANYFAEVKRFDRDVGKLLSVLREHDELQNTIVVIAGDHGWPFPRGKTQLYDSGTRVPLAIRWPEKIRDGQTVRKPVNLADLAPTFLDVAGIRPPDGMTARSLLPLMRSDVEVQHPEHWKQVFLGRERHIPSQEKPETGGYPMRAIRTKSYLYIRNFAPDRWPSGTPHWKKAFYTGAWLADCDNGPTKFYMWAHRNDPGVQKTYDLAFGKRPKEELYHIPEDPHQIKNLADDPEYRDVKQKLRKRLMNELRSTKDPRVLKKGIEFDIQPYPGGGPEWPGQQVIDSYK